MTGCGAEKKNETETESTEQSTTKNAYSYEYEGKSIYITQPIEEALQALGDDYEYFEAPSCAVDGLDMFYYYRNITVMANQIDDKVIVTDIYFKNDTVATTEGLRMNDSYADVVGIYGDDYSIDGTAMEYDGGNMQLVIDMNDGKVAAIEYEYK
jgi:hypothetical protein